MSMQVEITGSPLLFATLVAVLRAKGVEMTSSRRRPGEILLKNKRQRMYLSGYADETPVSSEFAEHCVKHLLATDEFGDLETQA